MEDTCFEGKIIVFAAPSGAGKSTIVKEMLKRLDNLAFSVSATTRSPREGEQHGVHYYYLSVEDFEAKVKNEQFVEFEEVYEDVYYGTLKSELERLWSKKKHVVFDIDVEGAKNIKKLYQEKAITIFVLPPSLEELERRLLSRGTDDAESIKKRVAKFSKEMKSLANFDIQLINDDLETAFNEAETVISEFLKECE